MYAGGLGVNLGARGEVGRGETVRGQAKLKLGSIKGKSRIVS